MILIGLGSNLISGIFNSPREVIKAALEKISNKDIHIVKESKFYQSEPVPKSDQPWFVNAVVHIETDYSPSELLHILHDIENEMGRLRRQRWEARIIDLDILAYDDVILPSINKWSDHQKNITADELILPHPRMHERLFVVIPLMDIDPDWHHPVLKKTATQFLNENTSDEVVQIMEG